MRPRVGQAVVTRAIPMPTWVLALSYWLHLIATIVWVGGLRPCEEARVRPDSEQRLRLTLLAAASDVTAQAPLRTQAPNSTAVQGELWPNRC